MKTITLDMYQTLFVAVIALYIGSVIKKHSRFFKHFCIPAPVIGGTLFSIITCIFYVTGLVEIQFVDTLKEVCMIFFFTSVGFKANLKLLKSGGKRFIKLLVVVALIALFQNLVAVGLSYALKLKPLIGLCVGSISMMGGHGTSGAFGPVLESLGVTGATTIATAAATFGLIAGSFMGAPLGNHLVVKKKLAENHVEQEHFELSEEIVRVADVSNYMKATMLLVVAVGIGSVISFLISKTGMIFPSYIGAMLVGAVICNIGVYTKKINIYIEEINDIGIIMLELFLGIALVSLKLWLLAELAIPMIVLLVAQTVFMFFFARYAIFNILGHDYDAAVLTAGTVGFGLGATPNAMANIQSVTYNRPPSSLSFVLVPVVGGIFLDLINSAMILLFINIFK